MSEILKIIAEMTPDLGVRARVFACLATPAGEYAALEIDLEIRRRIGALVAQVAADLLSELERTKRDLADASSLVLDQTRALTAEMRGRDGAGDYERELAGLDPATRAIFRDAIESASAGSPAPLSSGGTTFADGSEGEA